MLRKLQEAKTLKLNFSVTSPNTEPQNDGNAYGHGGVYDKYVIFISLSQTASGATI